jgi:probable phosphoglycerate mutase
MPPRFFLLRHGRSVANELGLIASHALPAGDAYGLTREGRRQVERSVQAAIADGSLVAPTVVVASPLLRARESAAVAASLVGVVPAIDPRLTERGFGDLDLGPDDAYTQVWEADRADPAHTRWGVESVHHVLRRAAAVVAELADDPAHGSVLLCTHGDVASTLLCAARGAPMGHHRDDGAVDTGALREIPAIDRLLDVEV